MLRFLLITLLFWINASASYAQLPALSRYLTTTGKLRALEEYASEQSKDENYQHLISASQLALKLLEKAPNDSLSARFFYYLGLGYEYTDRFDSAIVYYEESDCIARRIHHVKYQVNARSRLVDMYVQTGKKEPLNRILFDLEDLARQSNDEDLLAQTQSFLGNYYQGEYQNEKAIAYLLKSLRYYQKTNYAIGVGVQLANLGSTYYQDGQYQKSLRYNQDAISYLLEYRYGLAMCYHFMGMSYEKLHQPDSALHWYKQTIRIGQEDGNQFVLSKAYQDMGSVYTTLRQYQPATRYLRMALQLTDSLHLYLDGMNVVLLLGELADRRENYPEAKAYFEQMLVYAKKVGGKVYLLEAYQNLAKANASLQHYKQAYEYQMLSAQYQDSINRENSSRNMAEMEIRYQTEKKQQQIALLNEQNLVQGLQLSVRRRNEIMLLLGLGAFGLVGAVGYRRYRRRSQLEMEKVRSSIAADFHDELGANLSSIALYSDILLQHAGGQSDKTAPLLANINQNARHTVSAINDLIWTIKPDNDVLERTLVRMKEFAIPLLEAKQMAFAFHVDQDLPKAELDMTVRKILYLVFKEAINNALKYSEASQVSVRLTQAAGKIRMEVADNGKGFDLEAVRLGNGLANMQKRAAEINGQFLIDTQPGKGCQLRLIFKRV